MSTRLINAYEECSCFGEVNFFRHVGSIEISQNSGDQVKKTAIETFGMLKSAYVEQVSLNGRGRCEGEPQSRRWRRCLLHSWCWRWYSSLNCSKETDPKLNFVEATQQSAQQVWPSPLTDIRITGSDSYIASPYLPPQCSCNHTAPPTSLPLLLLMRSTEARSESLDCTLLRNGSFIHAFQVHFILGPCRITIWRKWGQWLQYAPVFISTCNHKMSAELRPSYPHLNIEILQRFQSKALLMTVDAPRYVPNTVIRRDLHTPTVKEEISRYSSQYSARLSAHPNGLVVSLMELPDNRRLRRHLPNDLPTRFLV
jgi:hypothetical protein